MTESIQAQIEKIKENLKKVTVKANSEGEKMLLKGGDKIASNAKKKFRTRLDESIDDLPPRVQTGLLRASINKKSTREVSGNSYRFFVEVGTDVKYASAVEFGREGKHPHPYLTPAFNEEKTKIIEEIENAVGKVANDAQG